MASNDFDNLLWNKLKEHYGHNVCIAVYGDPNDPANVSLECEECGSVILDAEMYTICGRSDC